METAWRAWVEARWEYRTVMAIKAWPRSSLRTRGLTPAMARREAKVWRRSWKQKSSIPACLREGADLLKTNRQKR